MSQASANLNLMIDAARKAARGLLRDFGEVENLQVSMKGAGDFVSRADIKAEATIRELLMETRPNYGWVGEESAPVAGTDPTRRWIVDPLDGTTNFLHATPHWAISIALEHRREIVAAVVFDPVKDEMFTAEKGQGAWLNDRRIRVSGRRDLGECIFGTSIPCTGRPNAARTIAAFQAIGPKAAGLRSTGSSALNVAYVAAGRLDGMWDFNIKSWDIAAGILLVREAGGFVAPVRAEGDMLDGDGIIASNTDIHAKLMDEIRAV